MNLNYNQNNFINLFEELLIALLDFNLLTILGLITLVPVISLLFWYFKTPNVKLSFVYDLHSPIKTPSGRDFTHALSVVNASSKDIVLEKIEVFVQKKDEIKKIKGDWEFHDAVLKSRYRKKKIKWKNFYHYEIEIKSKINANRTSGFFFTYPNYKGVDIKDLDIYFAITAKFAKVEGLGEVLGYNSRSKKYKTKFNPKLM